MKVWTVLALGLLVCLPARAENIRLVSGLCDGSQTIESTGFVFKSGQDIYVLGSADLVFNSASEPFCQVAIDWTGQRVALKLLRYDWAKGVVLLQAPASLAQVASPFAAAAPRLLGKASWVGGSGIVVATHSHRNHFAMMNETLELKSSAATPMQSVGSAVLDNSGQLIGFVSSQFIEEVPGHSSRVVRWLDRQQGATAQLVAIPALTIQEWLKTVTQSNWLPFVQISAQDQLKKVFRLELGGLMFTEDCPPPDSQPGEDANYPIGGGDPVGIGGDTVSAPACNFAVASADGARQPSAPFSKSRATLIEKLKQYLKDGVSVTVKNAYFRDENHQLQSQGVVSLGNFGQTFLREESGFLLGLKGANKPHEERLKTLRHNALQLVAEVLRPWGLMSVRQRSYLYGMLTQTDDWQVVTMQDLQSLYDDAYNDHTSLMYIYQDVESVMKERKALGQ